MDLGIVSRFFSPKRILDIGANVGNFCKECKKVFPEAVVFCIEANSECEPELSKVADDHLIVLLGDVNRRVTYYRAKSDPTASGNSIYREKTLFFRDENVRTTEEFAVRLDDLAEADLALHFHALLGFDLVKLDTQGSEINIVEGGLNLCQKAKGLLLEVSLMPYNEGAPLYTDVVRYMAGIGFFQIAILDHSEIQQDILFLNERFFTKDGKEKE